MCNIYASIIRLATFQLRDAADTWWMSIKNTIVVATKTWAMFMGLFLEDLNTEVYITCFVVFSREPTNLLFWRVLSFALMIEV